MVQRPAVNMAVLRVKAKLARTLSYSVKCRQLPGNEGVVRLRQDVSIMIRNLLRPTVRYVIFMIRRGPVLCALKYSLWFKAIFAAFSWIRADYKESETQENDVDLQRKLLFRETYFWNISSATHYRLHSTLKPPEQEDHRVLSLMSAIGGCH